MVTWKLYPKHFVYNHVEKEHEYMQTEDRQLLFDSNVNLDEELGVDFEAYRSDDGLFYRGCIKMLDSPAG